MLLLEDKRTIDYQIFLNSLKGKNPKAVLLLQLRNWLFSVLKFDPNTGDPLLSDMTSFLDKVSGLIPFNKEELEEIKNNKFDLLYKSLSYNRRSLLYLLGSPRNEIIRSHERMNIYQAREIDSAGIMEISRRPGRTVKEKVAVKPTILAVKREQGEDTLENRLFKKYLVRLVNVLDERQKCFDDLENENSTLSRLYSVIRRWLKSEEADRIGKWQNLPPNNILLHDKNYRKIWRGWQFLLDLDEMILNDWKDIDRLLSVYIFWNTLSNLQKKGSKIKQSPLKFDYDKFEICNIPFESDNCVRVEAENYALEMKGNKITVIPKEGKEHIIEIHFDRFIIENKVMPGALLSLDDADKFSRKLANSVDKILEMRRLATGFEEEQKFTAINFSEFPYKSVSVSSSDNFESRDFSTRLTRQFWTANTETEWIDLETSNSPASYFERVNNYTIETVSFEDIFLETEKQILSEEKLSSAAYDFMNSIRDFYNTNTLYYLLPDYLEEFSLSRIRSTANTVFPSANPLPKSIGTVFAFHNSEEFKNLSLGENDFVFVIEKSNDNSLFSITPIQVRTTFELNNQKIIKLSDYQEIPYGIRWEHHPSVIIENYEPSKVMDYVKNTVSETEGIKKAKKIVIISGQKSIEKARLELPAENWLFFNRAFEASEGAAFFAHIQEKVKDIPMWIEHLPNLQMSVIQNGMRDFISLTNGKTVLPVRGRAQELNISREFTLNKNVPEYHFRLVRGDGENSSALKYEAYLSNSAFPLKDNVTCKLQMNYTYGKEQPFDLYFVPVASSSFIRAKVEWKKIDEASFPVPNFPPLRKWKEFISWENVKTKKKNNLVDWTNRNFRYIDELQKFCAGEEFEAKEFARYTINTDLCRERDVILFEEKRYYKIHLDNNKAALLSSNKVKDLVRTGNKEISFSINLRKGTNNYYIANGLTSGKSLARVIFKGLPGLFRFPAMQIWNNRRTITQDEDTPVELLDSMKNAQKALEQLLSNEEIKQIPTLWNELMLLACLIHEDGRSVSEDFILNKLNQKFEVPERWRDKDLQVFQFGYFIDNAESDIQKKVFEWALDVNRDIEYEVCSFKLQILTIALWRNEQLLQEIPVEKMKLLFDIVSYAVDQEYNQLKALQSEGKKLSNRLLSPLRSHFELLCALIRSRQTGAEYQELFSPFSPEIKKSISKIEEIHAWLKKSEWANPDSSKELYARQIKFTSSDSDDNNSFLDYLLLWLDGEKSTEMPRIESATSENPDDDEDSTESDDE